jgi:hypothetical protein
MSEPANKLAGKMVVQLTADELRAIVAEAVRAEVKSFAREDKLLTVKQVCRHSQR